MSEMLRISEIFGPTIQGEGALIGEPTVFVRTGGCDYRCSWCDTLHAVETRYRDTWMPMSSDAIWAEVRRLSGDKPVMVSLSGGNPAIQPLGELIRMGHAQGYRFALETQGSIARDWFAELDVLVLSPKPPSSGMAMNWAALQTCIDATQGRHDPVLKIVVFGEVDYAFAREVAERHPRLPVVVQPGNPTPPRPGAEAEQGIDLGESLDRLRWLVERVMQDRWFEARVLPQLHTLIWGNRRGV